MSSGVDPFATTVAIATTLGVGLVPSFQTLLESRQARTSAAQTPVVTELEGDSAGHVPATMPNGTPINPLAGSPEITPINQPPEVEDN